MIPGSNLFRQASRVIRPAKVPYYQFEGRTKNAVKQFTPTFLAAVDIWCSVQQVPRGAYKQFGLDFAKKYVKIFGEVNLTVVDRDSAGDRFVWNSRLYKFTDDNDWFVQDGWMSAIGVDIGPFTGTVDT